MKKVLVVFISIIISACSTEEINVPGTGGPKDAIVKFEVSVENITITEGDFVYSYKSETNRNLPAVIEFTNEGVVILSEEISIPANGIGNGVINISNQTQVTEVEYIILVEGIVNTTGSFTTLPVTYENVQTLAAGGTGMPISLTNNLDNVPFAQWKYDVNGDIELDDIIFEFRLYAGNQTHPAELFESITISRFTVSLDDINLWEEVENGVFHFSFENALGHSLEILKESGSIVEDARASTLDYQRTDTFLYKLNILGKDNKGQVFGQNSEGHLIVM
jgi:hypothetical protein